MTPDQRGQSVIETLIALPVIFAFSFALLSAFDAAITAVAVDHALEDLLLCGTFREPQSCVRQTSSDWQSRKAARIRFHWVSSVPRLKATAQGRCLLGWTLIRTRELEWPPAL